MSRISLKIVGASGQGINSIGAIIAKGLKRSGYCVFGYREYPSLIKGGHASYQLDILTTYQLLRHSRAAGRAAAFGAGWRCAAGRG